MKKETNVMMLSNWVRRNEIIILFWFLPLTQVSSYLSLEMGISFIIFLFLSEHDRKRGIGDVFTLFFFSCISLLKKLLYFSFYLIIMIYFCWNDSRFISGHFCLLKKIKLFWWIEMYNSYSKDLKNILWIFFFFPINVLFVLLIEDFVWNIQTNFNTV